MEKPTPTLHADNRPVENGAIEVESKNISGEQIQPKTTVSSNEGEPTEEVHERRKWHRFLLDNLKERGSALQIVIAAALAIAIGLIVTSTTDSVPAPVAPLVGILGTLWLRSLKAVGKAPPFRLEKCRKMLPAYTAAKQFSRSSSAP